MTAEYTRGLRRVPSTVQQNLRERFESRLDKRGPVPAHAPELGPCHTWLGSRRGDNYGALWAFGGKRYAHHVAYWLLHGRWPKPCGILLCLNRSCANGAHVRSGTMADAHRLSISLGRSGRGKGHPRSLGNRAVRACRARYAANPSRGVITSLAKAHGVAYVTMWRHCTGRVSR